MLANQKTASGRRVERKRARASSHLENSDSGKAIKSPNKRLTRRRAVLQSSEEDSASDTHDSVDSELDSEDSLPARDSNNRGRPTRSGTDRGRSDCGPGSSAGAGPSTKQKEAESGSENQCTICLDAPPVAVCIPCGHIAGCMECLTKIKNKGWGCPVCRTPIQQVYKTFST